MANKVEDALLCLGKREMLAIKSSYLLFYLELLVSFL
jgi:hypothetical protein